MSTMFRDISSIDAVPSHVETSSRLFGLSSGKTTFLSSLLSQDSRRQNMQFGSHNSVDYIPDQGFGTSVYQSATMGVRSFGLQSRNSASHPSVIPEGSFRLNQDFSQRYNNTSNVCKPAVRNTMLTRRLQMQDSIRYNNDIVDSEGFRKPKSLGLIRGRSSTLSSRLFHSQNTDRHYKDLSNINGFNISHISRRDVNTLSESRLPLGTRSNCIENQSLSGSVLSVVSMKAQFMNLLENLHHSILSIGPHATADAVRLEFDKAKQGLENMSEMSFARTIKPTDTTSVVSQSSKYICPAVCNDTAASSTIDGGLLNLKSSNSFLKALITSKNKYKKMFNLSTQVEEIERDDTVITSSRNKESDDKEELVFKKPRPYTSKRKTPRMKITAPPAVKNSLSKVENKEISLKQWYPIAVGSNLAFYGVDKKGASVKTDAVKRRLNNRKVELVTGLDCNLIGSPSKIVSVLPQKIVKMLKNGLTDRWRVLQRELLNCQTAEEETKKRKSESFRVKSPPEKKVEKTSRERPKKENPKRPRVLSTPKKKLDELHTRSGRTVKPPGLFWLANGGNKVSSSLEVCETTVEESSKKASRKSRGASPAKTKRATSASPSKKLEKANEESPVKKATARSSKKEKQIDEESPRKIDKKIQEGSPNKRQKKVNEESPTKKYQKGKGSPSQKGKKATEVSPSKKYKKINESPRHKGKAVVLSPAKRKTGGKECFSKNSKRKLQKVRSPKGRKRKENKDEAIVTSTEDIRHENKTRFLRGSKRKGEVGADADSVEAKKSKLEKKTEVEVESAVRSTESGTKGGKKTLTTFSTVSESPISKRNKSSAAKNKKATAKKKPVKNAGESLNETSEFTEFEKNFEFKLDDIEIPEIANISGNPQLSRSQLRLVSMETPPLKYFNSNLKLPGSATPMRSPDWCISQRTESEVKQFQRRREEAFRKRIKIDLKKTVVTEKNVQNKDVKRVMEWVAEKAVRSPQWNSKVLQYVIPSRKRMEEQDDEDDTDFF